MIEEYYINRDTLFIKSIDNNKSEIYDLNGKYIINQNIFDLVEENCEYYGSSYKGRYVGSKKMLNMNYKLPIILDEVNEIIIFPTSSPKLDKCMWICLNNIENYQKFKDVSNIKFINKETYETNISFNSLENQIMRATMLLMKLKKRKNKSIKIG